MTPQSRANAEPDTDTDADDATVIQLSRHEPEHFTVLFRRHAPHIQRYVVRRLGPDAADDIVAETFLLAFRQRNSYDPTNGVTGILFDARTYEFAGYVKGGGQTLLLQQANVSGPGVRP